MKLFFRKLGSGSPLIILHGLFGSSDNWMSIARKLENSFTVYLPDLRNHGQSPHSEIHNYESICNDILELTEECRLDKFYLAGHSMGGKAAVRFAINYPDMLEGLIIADISPFATETSLSRSFSLHNELLNLMSNTEISGFNKRNDLENLFREKIKSERVANLVIKNLKRNEDGSFSWKTNIKAIHNNLSSIMEDATAGIKDAAPVTGVPVLFLRGEHSDYIPDKDLPGIKYLFPEVRFITINNAGHWLHSDNPEDVVKIFLTLLK